MVDVAMYLYIVQYMLHPLEKAGMMVLFDFSNT